VFTGVDLANLPHPEPGAWKLYPVPTTEFPAWHVRIHRSQGPELDAPKLVPAWPSHSRNINRREIHVERIAGRVLPVKIFV